MKGAWRFVVLNGLVGGLAGATVGLFASRSETLFFFLGYVAAEVGRRVTARAQAAAYRAEKDGVD